MVLSRNTCWLIPGLLLLSFVYTFIIPLWWPHILAQFDCKACRLQQGTSSYRRNLVRQFGFTMFQAASLETALKRALLCLITYPKHESLLIRLLDNIVQPIGKICFDFRPEIETTIWEFSNNSFWNRVHHVNVPSCQLPHSIHTCSRLATDYWTLSRESWVGFNILVSVIGRV